MGSKKNTEKQRRMEAGKRRSKNINNSANGKKRKKEGEILERIHESQYKMKTWKVRKMEN